MKFIKLCSTDGEIIVNVNRIICGVSDPQSPETTMIYLENSPCFEVSCSLDELRNEILK